MGFSSYPGKDPHGISTFEGFLGDRNFEVVIISINNKKMLSIGLNLKYYKHLKQLSLKIHSILASNVTGIEAENLLRKYSKEKDLQVLDILAYYYALISLMK